MFGDDVWREGGQAEAIRLAELLEAPVFASRQIFVNFPNRHPLFCGNYPISKDFEKVTGLQPDVLFLVGCQGVHGAVTEPSVLQIGPNPILMGRHYPLDVAVQCDTRGTLAALCEALKKRPGAEGWAKQRAKVRAFAKTLIEREEKLVREHSHDAIIHPAVLGAQLAAAVWPPVDPYELGHQEAIQWLRSWLSTDEGLQASKLLREGVKAQIQQHIQALQIEAQMKAMIAMAGQPPMPTPDQGGQATGPGGGRDGSTGKKKKSRDGKKAQARANMKAPQTNDTTPTKRPEPRPQPQA